MRTFKKSYWQWYTRVRNLGTGVVYALLTIWAVLALFPIYWMFKNSLEPDKLLGLWPPRVLPQWESITIANFRILFRRFPIGRWFLNSVVVAVVRTGGAVFFGSLAGYAFAKLRFFGREIIFWMLMAVLMLPGFVLVVPKYQLIRAFGWYDTFRALILPGITGGASAVFLMRQHIRTLPTELIECARLDGANEFTIFMRVIVPLAAPGMAVLGIFWFIGNWNNFLWPMLTTATNEMRTLPVGLAFLISPFIGHQEPIGQILAGASIGALPMIAVFLFFQRYFLKGITVGAVKG